MIDIVTVLINHDLIIGHEGFENNTKRLDKMNTVFDFLINAKNSWPKKTVLTHGKQDISFKELFLIEPTSSSLL